MRPNVRCYSLFARAKSTRPFCYEKIRDQFKWFCSNQCLACNRIFPVHSVPGRADTEWCIELEWPNVPRSLYDLFYVMQNVKSLNQVFQDIRRFIYYTFAKLCMAVFICNIL